MQAWQATVQDEQGNVIFNPAITVYREDGTTLASIYNENGTVKANPFIGTLEGFAQFWANPGTYKVVGASGADTTKVWDVNLGEIEYDFASVAALLSITLPIAVGQIVFARREGISYIAVAGGSNDFDAQTAGGVKLRYIPASNNIGTIVIYGSSTLRGGGSTGAVDPTGNNNWTGGPNAVATLFKNRIGSRGTVINRSVGGRSMEDLVNNFDNEVSRYRPQFVITGSGWANEPGDTGHERAQSYLKWAAILIKQCRSIGAEPIFAAFNPLNNLANMRYDQYDVMRGISEMGARIWPLYGAAATSGFLFKSGLNADSIHANDAGHLVYLEQFAIHDLYTRSPITRRNEPKYEVVCPEAPTAPPARIEMSVAEDYCKSWTVSAVIRNINATASTSAFLYFRHNGAGGEFRIRQTGGLLTLTIGTTNLIESTFDPRSDNLPHRHVVAYDGVSQEVKWWIDGVLIGTSSVTGAGDLTATDFGRNSTGAFDSQGLAIREFALWRWPALDDGLTVPSMEGGFRPNWGLVADADFSRPILSSMVNLANNRVTVGSLRAATVAAIGQSFGSGYVRHANGVQECWGTATLTYASVNRLNGSFSFPVNFVRADGISVTATPIFTGGFGVVKTGGSMLGVNVPSTSGVGIELYSNGLYTAGTETMNVMVRATGWWK